MPPKIAPAALEPVELCSAVLGGFPSYHSRVNGY